MHRPALDSDKGTTANKARRRSSGPAWTWEGPHVTETTEPTPSKRRASGLSGMLLPELKQMAGGLGIKGVGSMRKSQLIDAIRAAQTTGQTGGQTSGQTSDQPSGQTGSQPTGAASGQSSAQRADSGSGQRADASSAASNGQQAAHEQSPRTGEGAGSATSVEPTQVSDGSAGSRRSVRSDER